MLGVRFHYVAAKIRNIVVNLFGALLPPRHDLRIKRVCRGEIAGFDRCGKVNAQEKLDSVAAENSCDAGNVRQQALTNQVGFMVVDVNIINRQGVDADAGEQACVLAQASFIVTYFIISEEE